MAWLGVALAAFFLFAVAVVTDKLMLARTAIVPLSYAFSICLMSALASLVLYLPILIAERDFFLPRGFPLAAVSICGAAQFLGLLFMFEAVQRGEVSKTSPVIVSLQPVASLLLTLLLPPLLAAVAPRAPVGLEMIAIHKLPGVAMIVVGGYLLSQTGGKKTALSPAAWLYTALAGFLLAAANVFADISYTVFERAYLPPGSGAGGKELVFAKAFLWTRWMSLAGALVFVLLTGRFTVLRLAGRRASQKAAAAGGPRQPAAIRGGWVALLFLFGQGCGALAVLLQQYAIKLGNVVAVTALGGVQFFFVIALSAAFSRMFPRLLSESSSRGALLQKILWSALMFGGIALLAV